MKDPSIVVWTVLFGAIGLGFFVYGTRQRAIVPLFTGVSLLIFPYFISNVWLLVAVGAAFMALAYYVRI